MADVPDDAAEERWLADARAGDRDAFARLVGRYWDRLYRWLCHLARDPHRAEDLAQDAFLKAYSHLPRLRPGSNFRAWLFRVAYNGFVNSRRGAGGRSVAALPADVESADAGPVDEAEGREAAERVAAAVAALPPDFRSALLLRVDEGMSFKQAAAVLGITEETARWRVFKARQKLMQVLGPDECSPAAGPEGSAT